MGSAACLDMNKNRGGGDPVHRIPAAPVRAMGWQKRGGLAEVCFRGRLVANRVRLGWLAGLAVPLLHPDPRPGRRCR